MPDLLEPPKVKRGFFTTENAARYAALGHAARRLRESTVAAPANPQPVTLICDDFTTRKLARVRGQIDAVEKLLDAATEPQAVDRFANALTRLYDLERILAGRPLPGSRKPPAEPRPGQSTARPTPALVQPEPSPAPTEPAKPLGWEYDDPGAKP